MEELEAFHILVNQSCTIKAPFYAELYTIELTEQPPYCRKPEVRMFHYMTADDLSNNHATNLHESKDTWKTLLGKLSSNR